MFTSALRAEGVHDLFAQVDEVAVEARRRVSTSEVLETVRQALTRRPTTIRGKPLTLQSAAQVSTSPPTFALRVNMPDAVHFSYERYLMKSLRLAFGFSGSPIRISLRKAVGPRGEARR